MYENDDSPGARGMRLRLLRQSAKLKRGEFADIVKVSKASISYWENATNSHLSEKSAQKVIEALADRGIKCSAEWLLMGIGEGPKVVNNLKEKEGTQLPNIGLNTTTSQEIKLFKSNLSSVIYEIKDLSMSPILQVGDIVGGIWIDPKNIKNKEILCILEIEGKIQVRKVKKSMSDGRFDVSFASFIKDIYEPFEINGLILQKIAPIIRIWKNYENA